MRREATAIPGRPTVPGLFLLFSEPEHLPPVASRLRPPGSTNAPSSRRGSLMKTL
jgi:hypothetical protein